MTRHRALGRQLACELLGRRLLSWEPHDEPDAAEGLLSFLGIAPAVVLWRWDSTSYGLVLDPSGVGRRRSHYGAGLAMSPACDPAHFGYLASARRHYLFGADLAGEPWDVAVVLASLVVDGPPQLLACAAVLLSSGTVEVVSAPTALQVALARGDRL